MKAGVPRGVISVANDVLPQLVKAVKCMAQCNSLRLASFHVLDITKKCALNADGQKICFP